MEELETKIHEEMKQAIKDKTGCMIQSYSDVLDGTAKMFREVSDEISVDEIAKRADMFWNIALQRIDKEHAIAEQERQQAKQMMQRTTMPQGMPPMHRDPNAPESPCAKKARESAEKIKALEAEIVSDKESK